MPISKRTLIGLLTLSLAACGGVKGPASNSSTGVTAMKEVPAVRLNFRYEGDVPAPQTDQQNAAEERNQAVQGDFDNGRPQDELLDKTISSPGQQNILAVWHRAGDADGEFRLDMYDAAGHLLRKLTADSMSAKFPETIRWSPDSSTVAFVACIRTIATTNPLPVTAPTPPDASTGTTDANNAPPSGAPVTGVTPSAPTGILAFRTEQIYIANADGTGVKALTENEGLKYFYYVWSPDSSMLAALATTRREWQVQDLATGGKGEEMVPYGRPRIIEKNGRERRLDDAATQVQPVWSPDSAKLAVAYGNQIRVYDALGTSPTQAAVPLRNQLLISSQGYDEQQRNLLNAVNANTAADANANSNSNSNAPAATPTPSQGLSVLPDEKTLVSYNPIVALAWPQDDIVYLETAYVKRMKNAADNVTSFARWHRVVLSAQPAAPANK